LLGGGALLLLLPPVKGSQKPPVMGMFAKDDALGPVAMPVFWMMNWTICTAIHMQYTYTVLIHPICALFTRQHIVYVGTPTVSSQLVKYAHQMRIEHLSTSTGSTCYGQSKVYSIYRIGFYPEFNLSVMHIHKHIS
jgi:hypothetical protein